MQSIEARLSKLEREVRRWRVLAVGALSVATCLLVAAAQSLNAPRSIVADTVTAKRFSLELDGKVRAELGVDDAGPDNRIPGLFLYGKKDEKQELARFVVFEQTDTPELVFRNPNGSFQMHLAGSDKGASLNLCDERGVAIESLSGKKR